MVSSQSLYSAGSIDSTCTHSPPAELRAQWNRTIGRRRCSHRMSLARPQTAVALALRVMAPNVYGQRVEEDLVHVAPPPILAGLERLDDRVVGSVKVPGGVFVRRVVATPHVPTDLAEAQMHPGVPDPQAVLTAVRARRNLVDFREMYTPLAHTTIDVRHGCSFRVFTLAGWDRSHYNHSRQGRSQPAKGRPRLHPPYAVLLSTGRLLSILVRRRHES